MTHSKQISLKKSFSDFPIPRQLRFRLGLALTKVFPSHSLAVAEAPFRDNLSPFQKLLRNGLYARAFRDSDHKTLRAYLNHYWECQAAEFHRDWNDRFERMFLPYDSVALEELQKHLLSQPEPLIENIVEIGCGGGQLLNYLSEQFPDVGSLVGLDLGDEQIRQNKEAYAANSRLEFITADATEWIPRNTRSRTLFVSNGGVLEYFLKAELTALLHHISDQCQPSALIIVETIGSDHDLTNDSETHVYGRELSFSHNYPHLLREHGFQILHLSEREGFGIDGGGRWLRCCAWT